MAKFYTYVKLWKNKYYHVGYDNGVKFKGHDKYKPSCFVVSSEESKYKTLDGKNVNKMTFDSFNDMKDFYSNYSNDTFGMLGRKSQYAFISDNYKSDIDYDRSLIKILNFDIETDTSNGYIEPQNANGAIISITAKIFGKNEFHVFAFKDDYNSEEGKKLLHNKNCNIIYHKSCDEEDMLFEFLHFVNKESPDIITGWNVLEYDIEFLYNRCTKFYADSKLVNIKELSPLNIVDRDYDDSIVILGVTVLDMMKCYQTFTYSNQESYRLDWISHVELKSEKLNYDEYGTLDSLYNNDFQKFISYNVRDVELVERIDDKVGLLNIVFQLSYLSKINFDDTFFQVRMWTVLSFNELRKSNIVISNIAEEYQEYPGGFVKSPRLGFSDWIVSFDIDSLYPNIMIQQNISTDTIIQSNTIFGLSEIEDNINKMLRDDIIKTDNIMCGNNQQFLKGSLGFLPKLLSEFYEKRKEYKNKSKKYKKEGNKEFANKFNVLQLAMKIFLNSCYGATGNEHFFAYNPAVAGAVTSTGQFIIRTLEKDINLFLNNLFKTDIDYVVAIDTDSVYLDCSKFKSYLKENVTTQEITDFLDKISKTVIIPQFNKSFVKIANALNCSENRMSIKRENIAEKSIWIAKKRYIMKIWDSEGERFTTEPKYKIMGVEAVKSSTPSVIRSEMKGSFKILLNGTNDEFINFVDSLRSKFKNEELTNISFPRKVSDIEKFKNKKTIYSKGTPIHTRGALLYNYLLTTKKIKLEHIRSGDKIKFVYLKLPNPIKENIIAFKEFLPKEFGLNDYIDYDLQFNKSCVDPLKIITDVIGWNIEKKSNINKFMKRV